MGVIHLWSYQQNQQNHFLSGKIAILGRSKCSFLSKGRVFKLSGTIQKVALTASLPGYRAKTLLQVGQMIPFLMGLLEESTTLTIDCIKTFSPKGSETHAKEIPAY